MNLDFAVREIRRLSAEVARLRAALEIAEKAMHRVISGGNISFKELDAVREALTIEQSIEEKYRRGMSRPVPDKTMND